MKRYIYNVLVVLSLLLCSAVVALWIHSHQIADFLDLTTRSADRGFTEYGVSSMKGSFHVSRMHSLAVPPRLGFQWERFPANLVVVQNDHWGFGFSWQPGSGSHSPDWELWFPHWLAILIFALIALPRFWMTVVEGVKIERSLKNLCPNCGYDLRATPQRCPECGGIPKKPKER